MLRCSPCRYPICTCTCNIKDISERMHPMRSCIRRTYTMENRIEHDHWEWIRYPLIMDARATTPAVLGPTTPFIQPTLAVRALRLHHHHHQCVVLIFRQSGAPCAKGMTPIMEPVIIVWIGLDVGLPWTDAGIHGMIRTPRLG